MTRFETVPRLAAPAALQGITKVPANNGRAPREGESGITYQLHAIGPGRCPNERDLFVGLVWPLGGASGEATCDHGGCSLHRGQCLSHAYAPGTPYHGLIARYINAQRRYYTVDRLTQRLERLGYRAHLEPIVMTAA